MPQTGSIAVDVPRDVCGGSFFILPRYPLGYLGQQLSTREIPKSCGFEESCMAA